MPADLFGTDQPAAAGGRRGRPPAAARVGPSPGGPAARGRRREPKHSKELEKVAAFYANIVPPATPAETRFRHGHWEGRRAKVRQALTACNSNTFFMNRFDECGSECRVEYSPSLKKHRLRGNYCRCRHCEPCMRAKSLLIMANLRNRLSTRPEGRYRFITLTRRHDATPLALQIQEMYAWFKALRKLPVWKKTQIGGAVILEVKYNPAKKEWHPHLHIVTEGGWLPQDELARAWFQVTGHSDIVDVRALANHKDAAAYVAKYITKGTSPSVWDEPSTAQEWITASKGVRVANTYGGWRGFKLLGHENSATDWAPVCSLGGLFDAIARSERWAEDVLVNVRPPGSSDTS